MSKNDILDDLFLNVSIPSLFIMYEAILANSFIMINIIWKVLKWCQTQVNNKGEEVRNFKKLNDICFYNSH